MGGHNQDTQTQVAAQSAETQSTETGGTTEAAPSGPHFTSHGPLPPATHGFKDAKPSPSDVAFGSPPHGAAKPEAKHAEAKPAAKAAETKHEEKAEAKHEEKPAETKPEEKPAEAKPAEPKPAEEKTEAKPEPKPTEVKPETKPKSKDTFLTASQRAQLETEFMGRVGAAELAYVTALTDLRVDKLVEKEEELPIWLTLLVGVGGMAMESTVMSALMLLKKSGSAVKQLGEAGVSEIEHEAVEGNVLGLSEKTVEKLVGQMVDKAKEKTLAGAAAPAGGAAGEGAGEEKSATLNYIDYLRDNALVLFQHVREDKLTTATDAELLAVFASFDANFHKITMYRAKLEEQIKLYMASHAKEIGHRMKYADDQKGGMVREEVRVAKILIGSATRYAYVARDYDPPPGTSGGIMEPGKAYESEENALSYEEEGGWTEQPSMNQPYLIPERGHADAVPDGVLGWVEPELVDVAIASQEKRWLQKMNTFRLDYETGSPRLTKVAS